MTHHIIFLPLLFQAVLAVILLFYWAKVKTQKTISIIGGFVNIVWSLWLFYEVWHGGTLVVQAGNWPAPFGISFVADAFSTSMVVLTSVAGAAVSLFAAGTVVWERMKFGFLPIFHFLLMGLTGAFLTGDIFNLYVWFEIIIIASFVLLTLGSEKLQLEGAVKYFTLNMLASIIFLTGLGILYGLVGTLNMADLSLKVAEVENRNLLYVCALFFFVGFGIKSAVFPLYFWLPDSYHTPPAAVSAIFSGLLTKVGIYALIRVFSLIFIGDIFIDQVIRVVAILTILSGGVGALIQTNVRKVFAYLIICHIGFMMAGLGIFNYQAMVGTIFYMIHDITVKTNLFLIAGLIFKMKGIEDMRRLGGIYEEYPKLSLLIAISFFAVIGIPPLSGFWPKVPLITGSLEIGDYYTVVAILFGSFLTLMAVVKIWAQVFWKSRGDIPAKPGFEYYSELPKSTRAMIVGSIVMLTAVTLYISFGAEQFQVLSQRIATEIMDSGIYIDAVLGGE